MSFYTNQEILHTIEFERTREAHARRLFLEARRLARKNRRVGLAQRIGDSVIPMGTRRSEEQIAPSTARRLVAKSR